MYTTGWQTYNGSGYRGLFCTSVMVRKHTARIMSLYYKNITLTLTVSKYKYRALSNYRIYITLTQSHVPSVNTQLQYSHITV